MHRLRRLRQCLPVQRADHGNRCRKRRDPLAVLLGRCIFCARCEEVCPTTALRLSNQFELAVWRKEDLLESADFALCHCRQCGKAYAPQKEIDYALALLELGEQRREQFETCPACKQLQSLTQATVSTSAAI
ncbi:NADH-quinone oxidoreductase subunit I [Serratia plymuthica]|uniref:NADH-quinone oxidoreductase subunit I n=1 Tax=Serratia plymuthica TaxID=82996 RepID=A0A2X4Y9M2_SERPL|nr:NADH-quinone oxidoreductase subunit I [Serratia plymuthica]